MLLTAAAENPAPGTAAAAVAHTNTETEDWQTTLVKITAIAGGIIGIIVSFALLLAVEATIISAVILIAAGLLYANSSDCSCCRECLEAIGNTASNPTPPIATHHITYHRRLPRRHSLDAGLPTAWLRGSVPSPRRQVQPQQQSPSSAPTNAVAGSPSGQRTTAPPLRPPPGAPPQRAMRFRPANGAHAAPTNAVVGSPSGQRTAAPPLPPAPGAPPQLTMRFSPADGAHVNSTHAVPGSPSGQRTSATPLNPPPGARRHHTVFVHRRDRGAGEGSPRPSHVRGGRGGPF